MAVNDEGKIRVAGEEALREVLKIIKESNLDTATYYKLEDGQTPDDANKLGFWSPLGNNPYLFGELLMRSYYGLTIVYNPGQQNSYGVQYALVHMNSYNISTKIKLFIRSTNIGIEVENDTLIDPVWNKWEEVETSGIFKKGFYRANSSRHNIDNVPDGIFWECRPTVTNAPTKEGISYGVSFSIENIRYQIGVVTKGNRDIFARKQVQTGDETYKWNDWVILSRYDDTELKTDIAALKADKADKAEIPKKLSDLEGDKEGRLVSDAEKEAWSGKQDKLTAGDNVTISDEGIISANGGGKFDDTELRGLIEAKVNKEDGKGLSSNDFTSEYKAKIDDMKEYGLATMEEDGLMENTDKVFVEMYKQGYELTTYRSVIYYFADANKYLQTIDKNMYTDAAKACEAIFEEAPNSYIVTEAVKAIANVRSFNPILMDLKGNPISASTIDSIDYDEQMDLFAKEVMVYANSITLVDLTNMANNGDFLLKDKEKASSEEARAGEDDQAYMTPLKTKEAILSLSPPADISGKVDKEEGKGLSSNDFTDAYKAKVEGIPASPKYTDTIYNDSSIKERLNKIETEQLYHYSVKGNMNDFKKTGFWQNANLDVLNLPIARKYFSGLAWRDYTVSSPYLTQLAISDDDPTEVYLRRKPGSQDWTSWVNIKMLTGAEKEELDGSLDKLGEDIRGLKEAKQDKLKAGENISITADGVISAILGDAGKDIEFKSPDDMNDSIENEFWNVGPWIGNSPLNGPHIEKVTGNPEIKSTCYGVTFKPDSNTIVQIGFEPGYYLLFLRSGYIRDGGDIDWEDWAIISDGSGGSGGDYDDAELRELIQGKADRDELYIKAVPEGWNYDSKLDNGIYYFNGDIGNNLKTSNKLLIVYNLGLLSLDTSLEDTTDYYWEESKGKYRENYRLGHYLLNPYDSEFRATADRVSFLLENVAYEGGEITLPNASSTKAGVMTAADKVKLDKIPDSAEYTDTIYDDSAIRAEISKKQDKLTAGDNITISSDGRISAAGGNVYDDSDLRRRIDSKQDKLTAGRNISIDNGVISSADMIYDDTSLRASINKKQDKLTAGRNITIANGVISSADMVYDDTSLRASINKKQDKLTAGDNITITSDGKISAAGGSTYDDSGIRAEIEGLKTSKADKTAIPTKLSNLSEDSTHRTVTDSEKTKWNNKANEDLNKQKVTASTGASEWGTGSRALEYWIGDLDQRTRENKENAISSIGTKPVNGIAVIPYDGSTSGIPSNTLVFRMYKETVEVSFE